MSLVCAKSIYKTDLKWEFIKLFQLWFLVVTNDLKSQIIAKSSPFLLSFSPPPHQCWSHDLTHFEQQSPPTLHLFLTSFFMKKRKHQVRAFSPFVMFWNLLITFWKKELQLSEASPFFKCSPITLYHLISFPILISRTYWWFFFGGRYFNFIYCPAKWPPPDLWKPNTVGCIAKGIWS